MTKKWDLKEKFDTQDEKYHAIRDRFDLLVTAAGTHLTEATAGLAELVREEFETGKGTPAAKSRARADIDQATKDLAMAESERDQAYEYAQVNALIGRITIADLVADWNGPYRTSIRDERLNPIVDRIATARAELEAAMSDFNKLEQDYAGLYSSFKDLAHGTSTNTIKPIVEASDVA